MLWMDFGVVAEPGDALARLMQAHARTEWDTATEAVAGGKLTREQAVARTISTVQLDAPALAEATRAVAKPAPELHALQDWAHWHGWFGVVAGAVPDVVMNAVLDDARLTRVARHAGRLRFVYQWRLSFLSPRGVEVEDGFTVGYMAAFQRAGDLVVYVGDDAGDIEAARMAHAVFARGALFDGLTGEHPRVFSFETLAEIVPVLDREAEAWRAGFSPPGSALP